MIDKIAPHDWRRFQTLFERLAAMPELLACPFCSMELALFGLRGPRPSRRATRLPAEPVEHIATPKPLSKRARRRARGKADNRGGGK